MILNIYDESYMQYLGESNDVDVTPDDYSNCVSVGEACIQMMEENAANWRNFNRALALNEAQYLMEHGEEIVYEAGAIKGLINNGIEFVKRWLSKVLGVIQKFMAEISAKIASATKWVGVNKKYLSGASTFPKDKKFKDYNYRAAMDTIADYNFANPEKKLRIDDTMGVKAVGNRGEGIASVLKNSIKEWTGKEDTTCKTADIKSHVLGKEVNIDGNVWPVEKTVDTITKFTDCIKAINTARKDAQNVANSMIGSLKAIESNIKGDDANESAKGVHEVLKTVNAINAANNALLIAKLNVFTGALHQAQRVARIYVGAMNNTQKGAAMDAYDAEKKKKAKNESFIDSLDFDFV